MVFILSALCRRKITDLWKLSRVRDWLRGRLGLILMEEAMLSKSLIQFSVDELDCIPPCCLTWSKGMVREWRQWQHPSKGPTYTLSHSVLLTLQQAAANSQVYQRLLDTPGQAWASLLWGHCSFFLGPGVHKVLFVPSKSLLPQSCVSSLIKSHWPSKSNSLMGLSPVARSLGWEICGGP